MINLLDDLSEEFFYVNPDTSIIIAKSAAQIANKIKSFYLIGVTSTQIAKIFAMKSDLNISLQFDLKALEAFEKAERGKSPIMTSKVLGNIGLTYLDLGIYIKALDYSLRALKMKEDIGNKKEISNTLNNVGNVYLSLENDDKALRYYSESLKINEELSYKEGMAYNLGNIGIVLRRQKKHKEALEYYSRALAIDEELNKKAEVSRHLGHIGILYVFMDEEEKAMECFLKSLKISEELGKKDLISRNLGRIGKLYNEMAKKDENLKTKKQKYNAAIAYLLKGIEISEKINMLDLQKDQYENLGLIYSSGADYINALNYYKKSDLIKDSLLSIEKNKELTRHEMNYEFEKKEAATKAAQDKKDAVTSAEKTKQKTVLLLVTLVLILVFVFAGFIFRSLRITRKQKTFIEIKNKETEEQKRIIEEKNKDILDSIYYARRIQNSLLPTEKYLARNINK